MNISWLRHLIPARYRPIGYLTHLTQIRTKRTVMKGPFAGMQYVSGSVGSAYIPKLLGIYERELNNCVESICAAKPKLVVDVGAAEGYYAIGLARRLPQARVIAFEMNPEGRIALDEMARLNSVFERLEIRGKCELDDLAAALGNEISPVIVCDVEGYEETLLDPKAVPILCRTTILVEMHDFLVPNLTETLTQRFAATHRITHLCQKSRTRADFPWRTLGTSLLPKSYLDWAVDEWRPVAMTWLWMVPHG